MHTTNISICIGQTHLALLDAKLNYRNQADLLDTEDLNLKQILIFNAWACSQAQVEMSWPIIWIPTYTNNKYRTSSNTSLGLYFFTHRGMQTLIKEWLISTS